MDDLAAPECLRFFLQADSKPNLPGGLPPLFATLKRDFSGRTFQGVLVAMRAGERVRVTDAGQFGDTGITTYLREATAHMARASVNELERFSEKP
jgi:hypothetical protein